MERSKFARFIDNTTATVAVVILSFLTFRRYFDNIISLTLSLIIGFIILKTILHFQNKKYSKFAIEKEEKKLIEETNFYLRTMNKKNQLNFFSSILSNYSTKKVKGGILINNKVLLFIELQEDSLSPKNILEFYIKTKEYQKVYPNINLEEIIIICNDLSSSLKIFLTRFKDIKFTIFSPIETFALIKNHNCLPTEILDKKTQTHKKKLQISLIFNKKQAKTFYKCSALIYLSSLFVPFTKYYLITAGILFLLGTVCICTLNKEPELPHFSKTLLQKVPPLNTSKIQLMEHNN